MQVLGYIIGALFIAVCLGLTVWNIYKLVVAIKKRKSIKNENDITNNDEKGETN